MGPGEGGAATSNALCVEDRSLKAVCQNVIVLSVIMLSDSMNERLVRIVTTVGALLLQWHTDQSKFLRSCPASLQYLIDQVVGGDYMKHVEGMIGKLNSISAMEDCGFCIEGSLKEVMQFA